MLHDLSKQKMHHFQTEHLNTVRTVLIETQYGGVAKGHTDNYIKVHIKSENQLTNKIISVSMVESKSGYVDGKRIE